MRKALLLLLLAPWGLAAEMNLFVLEQGTERAVGGYYDVGAVAAGRLLDTSFRVRNSSASSDRLYGLNIAGAGFSFATLPALPVELARGAAADFVVRFAPPDMGAYSAYLNINGVRTVLAGTGKEKDPDPPVPQILVEPQALRGAQQATVSVRLASASKTSTSGELSMEFQAAVPGKATDRAVQFLATGNRSISFTVSEGDDMARFAGRPDTEFQTGTTAGSIVFSARLGPHTETLTVTVPSAEVVVDTARAARTPAGIEVRTTAFDTSRSATRLSFTFFDGQERMVAPGAIQVDGSHAFQQYFATTDLGSLFSLLAVFPVRGNASLIKAVEVELVNSLGITSTGRVPIQ